MKWPRLFQNHHRATAIVLVAAVAVWTVVLSALRIPDPTFDITVGKPAYTARGPRVLFDEAHHNIHTSGQDASAAGRAQGLAMPIGNGRLVALAEAGMLSGQLVGPSKAPIGMNPRYRQPPAGANILHWLSQKT